MRNTSLPPNVQSKLANVAVPTAKKPRVRNTADTSPASGGRPTPGTGSGTAGPPAPTAGGPAGGRPTPGGSRDASVPAGSRPTTSDPVDVSTGEVVVTQTDVELPGILPLVLSRTHVSSYRQGRLFGPAWASTLDQRLELRDDRAWFVAADGMVLEYPVPRPGGEPVLPEEGPRLPLTAAADGYTVTDPVAGHRLHFLREGDEAGGGARMWLLAAIEDRNANRVELEHDDGHALVRVHHGEWDLRVASAGGRVTGLFLTAPAGSGAAEQELVRFGYDDAARLVNVYDPSGRPLVFDYDPYGRLTGWRDRVGDWYRYEYDEAGRCVLATGTNRVLERRLAYDADRTTTTDPQGHTHTYRLNRLRQVVEEIDALGRVTRREWDRYDRLLAHTDPLGRTTRYDYDPDGNLTDVAYPDGTRTTVAYHAPRLPAEATDRDGSVHRFDYDTRGNVAAVTDPAGATVRYQYDPRGALTTVVDQIGGSYRIASNRAGLPVTVTDPTGAVTHYQYDRLGRPERVVDPTGGEYRFGWTQQGHLAWRRSPDGATERWEYDAEGNLVAYSDAAGATTRWEIGPFGTVAARVGPDGARLEFGYDTEQRLLRVTNPQRLVWRYEYDAAGQLIREIDFNGCPVTYRWDAAGQLAARTNGAGQSITYVHDLAGNIVEQRAGDQVSTFAYDPLGRLVAARNADAELTVRRDAAGRVVAETCNGMTIASGYDAAGRRSYRCTPSGAEAFWTFDARGLPAVLYTAGRAVTFTHDPAGREIERRLDSGVTLTQSWDGSHRLAGQMLTRTAGVSGAVGNVQLLLRRSWEHRPDGHLAGLTDSTGGRRFELDAAGRVTAVHGGEWQERYAYDSAGNLTEASWPPAAGDQFDAEVQGQREYAGTLLRRAGRVRYEYDAAGRVTLRQLRRLSGKPQTWRYRWNAEDRLTSVTTPDGAVWHYRYDPFGRRIAKLRYQPDGMVSEWTTFHWDGATLAEQTHWRAGAPGQSHRTVWDWDAETFRPLVQSEQTTLRDAPQEVIDRQFYAIVTDHIDTPTELVDPDGGIAWRLRATLWGATASGGVTDCPLRFPGQYFDPETGAHYNFHRYYDPTTARYHTPDPLGLTPAPNPHAYVPNPHQQTDPLGLTPCGAQRPANSPAYSVVYEARLGRGDFPGRSEQHHFAQANRQLHNAFQADPRFARDMEQLYPGIVHGVQPGPRGGFPRRGPIPGENGADPPLTWHHHATEPGLMQLIPFAEHRAPGPVQGSLHPGGRGGMENWGGGRR